MTLAIIIMLPVGAFLHWGIDRLAGKKIYIIKSKALK
jgi:hypothetical protein